MNAARTACVVVGLVLGAAVGICWPQMEAPPSPPTNGVSEAAGARGSRLAIPAAATPTIEPAARTVAGAAPEPAAAPPRVRVRGSLRIPVGWREVGELCFLPETLVGNEAGHGVLQGPEKHEIPFEALVRLGPGEYRFDAGELVPGTYEVLLRGCRWVQPFSLPALPEVEPRFVVPEPCDVELLVVDAESRQPIPVASETFQCFTGEGTGEPGKERDYRFVRYVNTHDWGYPWADPQPNPTFQCLPGRVCIRAELTNHRVEAFTFEAHAGQQRVVLPVVRTCGLDLVWNVEAEAVHGGRIEITRRNGEAIAVYGVDRESNHDGVKSYQMRYRVDEPGDYAFTALPPNGFEVTQSGVRYVTVTAGTWTQVEIQLRRR